MSFQLLKKTLHYLYNGYKKNEKLYKLLFSIFITLLLVIYVYYFLIDFEKIFEVFKIINYQYLFIGVFVYFVIKFLQAYQTKIIFNQYEIFYSNYEIFKFQQLSLFYNFFPASQITGSIISIFLFSKESGKRAQVTATLIYIRIITYLLIMPFIFWGLYMESHPLVSYFIIPSIVFLLLNIVLVLPFFCYSFSNFLANLLNKLIDFIPNQKIKNRIKSANEIFFLSVIECRKFDKKTHFLIYFVGILLQILSLVSCYYIYLVFGIQIPFYAVCWIFALNIVLPLIPFAINGIGVNELSLIAILGSTYNIGSENIVTMSVLTQLLALLFILLGAYYSIRFKKLNKAKEING